MFKLIVIGSRSSVFDVLSCISMLQFIYTCKQSNNSSNHLRESPSRAYWIVDPSQPWDHYSRSSPSSTRSSNTNSKLLRLGGGLLARQIAMMSESAPMLYQFASARAVSSAMVTGMLQRSVWLFIEIGSLEFCLLIHALDNSLFLDFFLFFPPHVGYFDYCSYLVP